jgi:AraC-like DNA-binding protein
VRPLYAIGPPRVGGTYGYPPHYHGSIEIIIIPPRTRGIIRAGESVFALERESAVLIPPMAIHSVSIDCRLETYTIPYIRISTGGLCAIVAAGTGHSEQSIREAIAQLPVSSLEEYCPALITHVRRLYFFGEQSAARDHRYPDKALNEAIGDLSIVTQIVSDVLAHAGSSPTPPSDHGTVRRVIDAVEQHFREPLDIETIARLTYMSKSHLCHAFKKRTGLSVKQYVNEVRVTHARKMLEQGIRNITQIAFECGYASPSYFCRVFRQIEGVSPGDWSSGKPKDADARPEA